MTDANQFFDAVTSTLNPLSIIQGLQNDPDTIALIGAIILSYAELEFRLAMVHNIAKGLPGDSLEFFETKLEGRRIQKFENEIVPVMTSRGYGDDFSIIMEALKRAKKFRNQYAHCIWSTEPPLKFIDLEAGAKTSNPQYSVVSPQLMKRQLTYIRTVAIFANYYQMLLGGTPSPPHEREHALILLTVDVPNHGE